MAQLVFESKNLGIGGVGFLVSSYAMTSTINPLFGNQKFRAGVQQSRELHDISFLHFYVGGFAIYRFEPSCPAAGLDHLS